MVTTDFDLQSDLDGEEPGGFVVVNLNARMTHPFQIMEEDAGGYFATLEQARDACRRWRQEYDNPDIFVYALVSVRDAVQSRPEAFAIE